MKNIKVGDKLVYVPKQNKDDNLHWPAVVEAIARRVRCRIFMENAEAGVIRYVSKKRLFDHADLFEEKTTGA